MKRILALLFGALLTLSLAACGTKQPAVKSTEIDPTVKEAMDALLEHEGAQAGEAAEIDGNDFEAVEYTDMDEERDYTVYVGLAGDRLATVTLKGIEADNEDVAAILKSISFRPLPEETSAAEEPTETTANESQTTAVPKPETTTAKESQTTAAGKPTEKTTVTQTTTTTILSPEQLATEPENGRIAEKGAFYVLVPKGWCKMEYTGDEMRIRLFNTRSAVDIQDDTPEIEIRVN